MDLFEFYESEENNFTQTGSYYIQKLGIHLPTRIYNEINDLRFKDERSFYEQLEFILNSHTSTYLFNGDICFFYPSIRDQIASKPITCQISGAPIVTGELYYTYRPLLDNLTTGKVYTISGTIKVSSGYESFLPLNLQEFEQMVSNFQLGLDSKSINFYDFKVNAGENALNLKLLTKKKQFQQSKCCI